jgi:Ca-activated chloride channel family protein
MQRRTAIQTLGFAGAAAFLPRLFSQQDFTIRSDVRLVLLDVAVKDKEGGFAAGLKRENFTVWENGRRQEITVFDNNDLPVTVGLLMDESRSMSPKRDDVLAAAQTLVQGSNPKDEMFVLSFNDDVKRGLPDGKMFSGNVEELRAALYRNAPQGRTAMNDAVVEGLKMLEQGRRDKKALVLVSDGGDNASQATRAQMIERVERSLATIYTIGIYDPDDIDKNPGILKLLAKTSGGESFFPEDPGKMNAICQAIAKEIRTRYSVGYIPPASTGPKDSLRHIRVTVSAPGRSSLVARCRTSYRYDILEQTSKK